MNIAEFSRSSLASRLSKIVTLPCHGSYTRRIGEHVLLVTDETRNHPTPYAEAFEQFR